MQEKLSIWAFSLKFYQIMLKEAKEVALSFKNNILVSYYFYYFKFSKASEAHLKRFHNGLSV